MLINPRYAIEQGWIKGIKDPEKQIQPNAIDFTLDKLFYIRPDVSFVLSESRKQMREFVKMEATSQHEGENFWLLSKGDTCDGMSDVYVEVPAGIAAKLIIRSTLNRNGLILTSGLYDAGFKGNLGFILHNQVGETYLAPGTRVGQIEFYKSDSEGLYSGGYNTEQGKHWANREGKK